MRNPARRDAVLPASRREMLRALCGFALPTLALPAFATPALAALSAERLKIRDLWAERGAFSPLAEKFNGQMVEMRGYMAPPLKPEIDFFVLTRIPMSVCPFCDNEASWPDDLVLVRMGGAVPVVPFNEPILTRGRLEIGTASDAATGFVSRVRLTGASYRVDG